MKKIDEIVKGLPDSKIKSLYRTSSIDDEDVEMQKKVIKMMTRMHSVCHNFSKDISNTNLVNYLLKICGYERVSAFTRHGYKKPANCICFKIDSDTLKDVFVKIQ